ncbi:preATP grasp domain-containing protein [Streptomyces sp. NPDC055366]
MRILIGNHIDPSIRARGDMRAWTQRLFWFARPGDLLVLCCEPDAEFADYALARTGVRREDLTVLAVPPGVWGEKLLEPSCLTAPAFLDRVRAAGGPARAARGGGGVSAVEEVFALWPSAAVARFAAAVSAADRDLGAAFFAQGGVLRNGGQLPALPDAIPPPWRTSGDGDSRHDTGGP